MGHGESHLGRVGFQKNSGPDTLLGEGDISATHVTMPRGHTKMKIRDRIA